ncbi:hypothetical protein NX059_001174 [Plenodomus lindquistii]|nr:hypothetical protein NX059_001174 [Plenodomus lindquistii]
MDLGYCKGWFKHRQCEFKSWELCPLRHWSPEPIEQRWHKDKFMREHLMKFQGPHLPPDNPHVKGSWMQIKATPTVEQTPAEANLSIELKKTYRAHGFKNVETTRHAATPKNTGASSSTGGDQKGSRPWSDLSEDEEEVFVTV